VTDALWRTIGARYRAWAGIGLGDRRREPVLVALRTLADELGYPDAQALLAAADRGDGAVLRDRLVARISVGLTWFGRELPLLAPALERAAARARGAGLDAVTVWSVGCSSGEEPFTIAMALLDCGARPRILATDISVDALATASRAHYPRTCLAAVPERWRARHFVDVDAATVAIAPAVRAAVSFARHNLAADPAPPAGWPRFDLVVCRNVLIYFEPAELPALAARLGGAAATPDDLIVGAVEQSLVGATRRAAGAAPARPTWPRATHAPQAGPPPAPRATPSPPTRAALAPPAVDPLDAVACLRRGDRRAARPPAHADAIELLRQRPPAGRRVAGWRRISWGSPSRPPARPRRGPRGLPPRGRRGRARRRSRACPRSIADAAALAATVAAACHARLAVLRAPAAVNPPGPKRL
jgi:chemotaxis protein methyltransferase CheR